MRAPPDLVVAVALAWTGTPYRHRTSARGQGADCLGLLRGVWRDLGLKEPEGLPPYSPRWHETDPGEPLLAAAGRWLVPGGPAPAIGDAVFFRMSRDGPARHCGILLPDDRFLHAYEGRAVLASRWSRWWSARLAGHASFPAPTGAPFHG